VLLGGKLKRTIIFESNQKIRVVLEDKRDTERSGSLKIDALMGPPDFYDEYHLEFTSEGTAGSCLAVSGVNNDTLLALARTNIGFQANFHEHRLIRNITGEGFVCGGSLQCGQSDYPNGPKGHRFDREVRQQDNGSVYLHVFETMPNGFKIIDQQLSPEM